MIGAVMSAELQTDGHRQGPACPTTAELRRLYVIDDLPMAALTAHYGVGHKQVRQWLIGAGIPIRTKQESGRRRQLTPPPTAELRRLYLSRRLTAAEIGTRFGVSSTTVLVWR